MNRDEMTAAVAIERGRIREKKTDDSAGWVYKVESSGSGAGGL